MSSSDSVALPPWFEPGGLLDEASAEARRQLQAAMELVHFAAGETLFAFGAAADHMLYVVEGELRVFRPDGPDAIEVDLTRIGAGQTVGELTFVTRGMRSASAQALVPVVAWRLPFDRLDAVLEAEPSVAVIYKHVAEQLSHTNLVSDNERVAGAVELSLAAKLLITVIAIQSGTLLATGLMTELMTEVGSSTIMLLGYLLFVTGIGVVYTTRIRLPPRAFGISLEGWKPALLEAAAATLATMTAILAIKWALVHFVPAYSAVPLLDIYDVTGTHGRTDAEQLRVLGFSVVGYALAGAFQELYARGMLQGQLYRFFRPRTPSPWPAILVSNLLFASLHVSWSMSLTLVSFLGGMLWGWLYARRPTLLGVTLSHVAIGLWFGRIVNLWALFKFGPLHILGG